MHIVYEIIIYRDILPNRYIGSKSNCQIYDGKIYNSKVKEFKPNKEYFGSSRDKEYKNVVQKHGYKVEILYECTDYKDALNKERELHLKFDVVASTEYFNKSIAQDNTYSNPDFATYRHSSINKCARLPRNHPKVLSGEWVGVTKGSIISPEDRKKRGLSGEKNPFWKKTHTNEAKEKMSKANAGKKHTIEFKKNVSKRFKGIPKSEEHKRKIGRSGYCMLKNIITGESIRILITERHQYDASLWKVPITLGQKKIQCPHCNMISNVTNINRWHNDNCKKRNNEN